GPKYWADTRLELPRKLAGRYTNALTGESVETAPAGDGAALPLADVFTAFPAALLLREAAR
ncbi:MAG TPA: hypothetical protein VK736_06350, partial [Candidatus Binatia bacterium]|nr:hypothetical protein [Candidatus Binatia bacterium]